MNIFTKLKESFQSIPIPWGVYKNQVFTNYSVNYETFVKEAYDNPYIYKALQEIITDFKTVKIGVYRDNKGKKEYVENHPVNKWLARPNAELNGKDFMEFYILYMYLGGGLLLYKTEGVMTKEIYMYSPDSFDIKRDSSYNISEIKIGTDVIPREKWGNYKVCKATNVNDKIAGKSQEFRPILKSLALIGDLTNYALMHQNRQLKNSGKRNGIVSYKGTMTPDKKEEMIKTISDMGKGENTGGLAFLPADTVDFKQMDLTVQELDWLESIKYIEEVISYCLGVPAPLISSRSSTYNNQKEAKKKVYVDTIIPLASDYCEDLTAFFQADLQPNESIWYNTADIEELKEDVLTEAKEVRETLKGIATVNEVRKAIWDRTGIELKPLKKDIGDKVLVTSSDMFLDDLNLDLTPVPDENPQDTAKE